MSEERPPASPDPQNGGPPRPAAPDKVRKLEPDHGNGTVPPGSVLIYTYRIDRLIGRGGMGEVYKAHHVELDTAHAIKMILPEMANDPKVVSLFRREASVLRQVRHPAVVSYDGVFRDENGRVYLVMEFVEGPSLDQLIRRAPLTVSEVRRLRDRVASGLADAHRQGVIHRDLSPNNIIVPDNDVSQAKIIDFGIAKVQDPEGGTIVGSMFAGRYSYASPEQVGMYGGIVDARSDIYTLGLVLAAAAVGKHLDMGTSLMSVIKAREHAPDLTAVPEPLRDELAWMLQPNPADRPASMEELLASVPPATLIEPLYGEADDDPATVVAPSISQLAPGAFSRPPTAPPAASIPPREATAQPVTAPPAAPETLPEPTLDVPQPRPQPLTDDPQRARRGGGGLAAIAAIVAVLVIGVGAWQFWPSETPEPLETARDDGANRPSAAGESGTPEELAAASPIDLAALQEAAPEEPAADDRADDIPAAGSVDAAAEADLPEDAADGPIDLTGEPATEEADAVPPEAAEAAAGSEPDLADVAAATPPDEAMAEPALVAAIAPVVDEVVPDPAGTPAETAGVPPEPASEDAAAETPAPGEDTGEPVADTPNEIAAVPPEVAPQPVEEPPAPVVTADPPADLDTAERRLVQRYLARLGLYSGAIDGLFGGGTRAGIERFQAMIGAEETGELTERQFTSLTQLAGLLPDPVAAEASAPDDRPAATQAPAAAVEQTAETPPAGTPAPAGGTGSPFSQDLLDRFGTGRTGVGGGTAAQRAQWTSTITQAILPCWQQQARTVTGSHPTVAIVVTLAEGGYVQSVTPGDPAQVESSADYRAMFEAVRRAVTDARCQPIPLPASDYPGWQTLRFRISG